MVGFRTKENAVFLADCLSSRETLEKYRVSFLTDVKSYLETLERVTNMDAAIFVPSHAETTDNIPDLAQYNMDKVHEINVFRRLTHDQYGGGAGLVGQNRVVSGRQA